MSYFFKYVSLSDEHKNNDDTHDESTALIPDDKNSSSPHATENNSSSPHATENEEPEFDQENGDHSESEF